MSWTVVPASAFAVHAARWQRLHASGPASPLLAPEFVSAALDIFGRGKELLAWYGQGEDTEAMAVLTPGCAGAWATFQPPQAPVGFWLQRGLGSPAPYLPSLLQALPGIAWMASLTQCDPLLQARPADDAGLRTLDYIQTARITLTDDFDSYWNGRGKNLRANLKKQRNRLRQDGLTTGLEVLRAPEAMAAAVGDYGRLEGSGWKASQGTAVAADNAQGRFYRTLLERFALRGAASVYRYRIGSKLVAMDLCIEGGGCVVVLKTAYDEGVGGQLSPALLMREEACREIFENGRTQRIEFYGRVMDWHLRWTDEVRTMYHLNAYRWPFLRRLHARGRLR